MAEIYWIHLPEHTDMFSEGYIGFTSRTSVERFEGHKSESKLNRRNSKVHNILRKHWDDIVLDVVCICSNEYGLWLEHALRPLPQIGWNVAPGGTSTNLGCKASEETRRKQSKAAIGRRHTAEAKQKISAASKLRKHSEATIAKMSEVKRGKRFTDQHRANMSKARKGKPQNLSAETRLHLSTISRMWRRSRTPFVWLLAAELHTSYSESPCGYKVLAKRFEIPFSSVMCILRYLKAGWNPNEDQEWLLWKEEYIQRQEDECLTD